ncbi:TetR/AcrR family transcriptional regulator [Herbiconiux flava]|uniref:AcrR family transcriptional regulator n=1 Tax=Herbiconiux flava TaxID=881268 RepID=A0A852SLS8_9MICO|nr:TetR/AcrR family transcriptional regulator [Herbiconiux flava]NYD69359.1 AcrR family transcriptional regulator [Herbiconiux flava]GLK16106.1 TetR family transcriptional regulator [Herbiconiux flava]
MSASGDTLGRRERKKAETRSRIAESARRLFLERGYGAVGIRDVAADADVAVTTLFSHFASKEALVFEHDEVFRQGFAESVSRRKPDESLISVLRRHVEGMVRHCGSKEARPIWDMIDRSPALRAYEESMLVRHADSLAIAISADDGLACPPIAGRAVARFVITAYSLARTSQHPTTTLDHVFPLIDAAWSARN